MLFYNFYNIVVDMDFVVDIDFVVVDMDFVVDIDFDIVNDMIVFFDRNFIMLV